MFAGLQIISQKGWLAVEVAPHTNTRRYFKRLSPREGPSDPPDQASPATRRFPKPNRRAGQSWRRPPLSNQKHAEHPAQEAWQGPERPPGQACAPSARKRKAPLRQAGRVGGFEMIAKGWCSRAGPRPSLAPERAVPGRAAPSPRRLTFV